MVGLAEKGAEVGASIAGSRAVKYAKEGRYKQALIWTVPLVIAGVAVWYMRRQGSEERRRQAA